MLPLAARKAVRTLVEEARTTGPLQPWRHPPKEPARAFMRFDFRLPQFKRDPRQLWAPEVAQSFAEGVLEAIEGGHLEIAFLRARTAADKEKEHCQAPGIYQQIFTLVAMLVEREHGREKEAKMTEAEQLKQIEDKLHEIAKEALSLRKHKITRSLLNVIEQIKSELTPKRTQMALDLAKKEEE